MNGTGSHIETPEAVRTPLRRVGVRLIAETVGVSIATVDRALHDRLDVNPLTKARVLQVAQELGYRPNLAARYLKSQVSLSIAGIVPVEVVSYFDEIRRGINDAVDHFAAAGLQVKYYNYPRMGVGEVEAVERALAGSPSGLVVVPGTPGALKRLIQRASRAKIPTVCLDTDAPGSGRLTAVTTDPVFGSSSAAELIGRFTQGKGSVVHVTGALETSVHGRQAEAFRRTLNSLFPGMQITGVLETHEQEDEAYQKVAAQIRRDHSLSAVYVSTANSVGVLRALQHLGLLGRITVVATHLFPLLADYIRSGAVAATVWERPRSLGRMSVEALFRYLAEGRCPRPKVELTPHILLRSNLERFMQTLQFGGSAWTATALSSREI